MGGSDQSEAAHDAYLTDLNTSQTSMAVALPILRELIGYSKGQLAEGEPGYVKQGYKDFNEGLTEKSRATSAADLSAEFTGSAVPQGGRALSEIGRLTSGGAGHGAQALSASSLSEGKTMFLHTQALLDSMSGTGGSGIGTSVAQAQQRISGIAGMRDYNPTTASILGVLGAGASVYGALNQQPYLGTSNGVPSSMGPGGFGYTDPTPINVTTGG